MKLFLLSKDDEALGLKELRALSGRDIRLLSPGIAMGQLSASQLSGRIYPRLAYTNAVYELLFTSDDPSDSDSLAMKMQNFDWQKHYEKDFRVVKTQVSGKRLKIPLNELADIIWRKLKAPKANLKDPKTVFELIVADNKVYAGKLLWENKKEFHKRKAHLRPALHPSSLSPKLARACINLTGIRKGVLLDPFCGSGGILIEAGSMGLKPVGIDLDPDMIKRADANLSHYADQSHYFIKDDNVKNHAKKHFKNSKRYELRCGDALKIRKRYGYIVTDLPYGKNTKCTDLEPLYLGFLHQLEAILGKAAVVIFPDLVNHKRLIAKTRLSIEAEFSYYIHKSMTKKIVLLKP